MILSSGFGLFSPSAFTGICCSLPWTTLIFAGTSTSLSPSGSFTTTVTSFSPGVVPSYGVVCPSGVLYSNVEPSG